MDLHTFIYIFAHMYSWTGGQARMARCFPLQMYYFFFLHIILAVVIAFSLFSFLQNSYIWNGRTYYYFLFHFGSISPFSVVYAVCDGETQNYTATQCLLLALKR